MKKKKTEKKKKQLKINIIRECQHFAVTEITEEY